MANNPEFAQALAVALKSLGTVRAVGDQWCSIHGIVPNGGLPYSGQEVSRATYSALWQWVQDRGLVISEVEWQSQYAAQNGNVTKFSDGDGSSTFRLPKVVGYIKGAEYSADAGEYTAEGLPNIEGTLGPSRSSHTYSGTDIPPTGPFSFTAVTGTTVIGSSSSNADVKRFDFDASKANEIYGNSNHVTPETVTVLFGVYAFGQISNPGELDLDWVVSQFSAIESKTLKLVRYD